MKIDEITKASLLYDFYGSLLPKRQLEVMELYYEENLSLSEIAKEFSISRQAVHDALRHAKSALEDYEKKLGLIAKFQTGKDAIDKIDKMIDSLIDDIRDQHIDGKIIVLKLEEVKDIIDKMEE